VAIQALKKVLSMKGTTMPRTSNRLSLAMRWTETPQRAVTSLEPMTDALSPATIRTDVRRRLNISISLPEDTPERFRRMTREIKVYGKPLESVLFRLQAEKAAAGKP
jgi:hypothetical protein